jgi:hypothetical protein
VAARRHQRLLRKRDSVLEHLQHLWASEPGYLQVEKRPEPPLAEFVERYVRGCRPVVLTTWPKIGQRGDAGLGRPEGRFGHLDVEDPGRALGESALRGDKLSHRA